MPPPYIHPAQTPVVGGPCLLGPGAAVQTTQGDEFWGAQGSQRGALGDSLPPPQRLHMWLKVPWTPSPAPTLPVSKAKLAQSYGFMPPATLSPLHEVGVGEKVQHPTPTALGDPPSLGLQPPSLCFTGELALHPTYTWNR